jgi:hypothetical protein
MVMARVGTPGNENGPKKLPTADCPLPTILTINAHGGVLHHGRENSAVIPAKSVFCGISPGWQTQKGRATGRLYSTTLNLYTATGHSIRMVSLFNQRFSGS